MTRKLVAVAAAIVAAAIAIVGYLVWPSDKSDCTVARALIDYNQQFNRQLEASGDWEGGQIGVPQYEEWAAQIRHLADEITDTSIAGHADALAVTADHMVPVVRHYLDAPAITDETQPPPYIAEFTKLGRQFDANLTALDQACPV